MPVADAPRIAFCVPRYGPEVVGGAETLCRLLAEDLAAHGTPVEVLTTTAVDHFTWADHHPEGTRIEGGVPVHRHAVSRARDGDRFWSLHVAIALGEDVGYAGELEWMANSVWSPGLQRAAEDTGRYDWVVAIPYLFGTAFWAAAARPERTAFIPCVHDERHAWTGAVRRALTEARGCLLNSGGERDLFVRIAPGAEWRVVGIGFEDEPPPDALAVEAFCAARGIAPGYLLYAGRREAAKGLPELFEGYAALRRAVPGAPPLALMGAGELPVPDDIAPHVIELGYVPLADRAAAYAAASVLVHPSRLESLGMVMLEAWLAGTPALVNADSPVLVDHCRASGGGLWYRGPGEFAAALEMLLEDPGLRADLAAAGRTYTTSEFSWPEVRRRFLGALEDWS